MQETWVQSLGQEDPLEKGMATHSSVLAWRIPWTEEPTAGYSPWDCKKVGHNWATNTFTFFLFSLGNKIESVSRNIFEGPSYSSLSWLASAAAELDEKSHHQENDFVLDNWHSQQVATLKKSSANTTAEVHLSATQWKPCIIHVGTKKLLGAPSVNEIRSHPKEEHVCLTTPTSIKVLTHSSTSSPLTRRATH